MMPVNKVHCAPGCVKTPDLRNFRGRVRRIIINKSRLAKRIISFLQQIGPPAESSPSETSS